MNKNSVIIRNKSPKMQLGRFESFRRSHKRQLILYLVIATLFFITSLKFSGAEAYHHSGITAYLKWAMISALLNVGFFIQFLRPMGWTKIVAILLMVLATIINFVVYSNPNNWILYDLLSVIVVMMSTYLILKGFFTNGKNIYA